jgi:hypothetical protein
VVKYQYVYVNVTTNGSTYAIRFTGEMGKSPLSTLIMFRAARRRESAGILDEADAAWAVRITLSI